MDSGPEVLRQIFETNFFGLTETTAGVPAAHEARRRRPAIVNISSVVGKRALPARSLYSASKFAVMGFSEAIRAELAKDGIDVSWSSRRTTQTNFSKNMLEQKAKVQLDRARHDREEVAVARLKGIDAGTLDVTLTFRGKLLVLVNRFAPWIVDFFSKKKVRELFADEIAERKKKQTAKPTAPRSSATCAESDLLSTSTTTNGRSLSTAFGPVPFTPSSRVVDLLERGDRRARTMIACARHRADAGQQRRRFVRGRGVHVDRRLAGS